MDKENPSPERHEQRKRILRKLGQVSIAILAKAAFMGVLWLLQHHFDLF